MRKLVGLRMSSSRKTVILAVVLVALLSFVTRQSYGIGCGCMDLALIVDDTGSMGGALDNVKTELPDIIATAQGASGGDLRIGLITFPSDNVVVNVPFTTDVATVESNIQALVASGGNGEPESSDTSLQFAITGSTDPSCTVSNAPFGSFRPGCVKIAVLITDARPGECSDNFTPGVSDVYAHNVAVQAAEAGVLVSAIYVPDDTDPTIAPVIKSVMEDYADTSGGVFVETGADGTGTGEGISDIVASCGTGAVKLDITRTSQFWFTHGFSSDTNCATLLAAIQLNGGFVDLGFVRLPTANRNGDNVEDATDAFIEALSFFYRSTGLTGENGGSQNAKLKASALCKARKQLAVELIAATANFRLLGTKPATATYVNSGVVTNFPSDLLSQAQTAGAAFDVPSIQSMTALLRKYNASGLTNDLPNGLVECSPQTAKILRPISQDPMTQNTCPGPNNSCGSAAVVSFSTNSSPFAPAVFKQTVNTSISTDNMPAPACGNGGPDAVWKILPTVGTSGRQFTVSSAGSNFNTLLAVWSGSCSNLVAITNGCADAQAGTAGESLSFTTDGSSTFFIVGEGSDGDFGSLKIKITSP
jgi:hypothetical protein